MEKYDFIIVGGGAAGFSAAIKANEIGIKTAIINAGLPMGGTCVNVGCVPSKFLLEVTDQNHRNNYPAFDSVKPVRTNLNFQKVMQEKDKLVLALREMNYKNVLTHLKNVEFIHGYVKFISKDRIEVNKKILQADKFLIATGSSTRILPIPGLKDAGYLTNKEALTLKKLPKSMLIIGGGPLGLEFAQIFSRFGTKVTLAARSRILSKNEPIATLELHKHLEKEITIYTKTAVTSVKKRNNKKIVTLSINNKSKVIETEEILLATGVVGNTYNLGLEAIGIKTDKNEFIKVNQKLQTEQKNIYSAGDVIGPPLLETVAAKEGNIACQNLLLNTDKKMDYRVIPFAVFTSPQYAGVGLTEHEYMKKHGTCSYRTIKMDQIPKALAVKDTKGLIFMVIHHKTKKIVGVHIVGHNASEIIHEATLAIKFGLTINDIIDTVHIFPTFSEAVKIVSQSFTKDMSKMSCCVE